MRYVTILYHQVKKDNEKSFLHHCCLFLEGCPNILNRTSWNARPYKRRTPLILPATHVVVRRVASWKINISQGFCIQTMKELQDEQMDEQRWDDIGFNFVICSDNNDQHQNYRARGWLYMGAHCLPYNDRSIGNTDFYFAMSALMFFIGIGVIGNYTNVNSLKTFKSLVQCGIAKNVLAKNFTLVGFTNSTDIYQYYLTHFKNDTDLSFSNQHDSTRTSCN